MQIVKNTTILYEPLQNYMLNPPGLSDEPQRNRNAVPFFLECIYTKKQAK